VGEHMLRVPWHSLGSALVLLAVAGSTTAQPEPPSRFDTAGCEGATRLLEAGGTDLQRSEVEGRYVLDEASFLEQYVAGRMDGRVSAGFPERVFPSSVDLELADPEEVPALEARRKEAESAFRREGAEAYQRAGPVLQVGEDGTWTSWRTDGATSLGGGPFVTRGREVVFLDTLDPKASSLGVVALRLTLEDDTLVSDRISWALFGWADVQRRFRRSGMREVRGANASAPTIVLPREAIIGTWRLKPASLAAFIEQHVRAVEGLRKSFERAEPERWQALLGTPSTIRAQLTQSLRFGADGGFVGEVLFEGHWMTNACGRWLLVGDSVVAWTAAPGIQRLHAQALTFHDGTLIQRVSPLQVQTAIFTRTGPR
jgi:hypothetical protein